MLERPGAFFDETGDARWYHDCYNFGCMAEAGVAYYRAAGDLKLLFAAVRFAEFLTARYGYGKINMVPSHSLPEEALLLLYVTLRDTEGLCARLEEMAEELSRKHPGVKAFSPDIEKYADLVRFWIENRGNHEGRVNRADYGPYAQDHAYYFDQTSAAGHAVRANLYYTGMAAAGVEFENYTYLETARKLWKKITGEQMYLSGGVGTHGAEESYGESFELPNDGYCETCAQVAMAFFTFYLQNAYEDASYADLIENYLYNGVLGGVGLDGESFFYTQPLNTAGHARWRWHDCACCPPMFLKFYSRLGRYVASYDDDTLLLHQYLSCELRLPSGAGLSMVSEMPWGGRTTLVVTGKRLLLKLRVPAWTNGIFTLRRGRKPVACKTEKGYASLTVYPGDSIEIEFPLFPRRIHADERVEADWGRVALGYGPILCCAEGVDNPDFFSENGEEEFAALSDRPLSASLDKTLPGGGAVAVRFWAIDRNRTLSEGKAIPFYLRANRGLSPAYVFLREEKGSALSAPEQPVSEENSAGE